MKYLFKLAIVLVILAAIPFIMLPVSADNLDGKEMRGLWVATVVNVDYPSKPTTDTDILKDEAIKILDTAKGAGLNAVFLQVRPTADAFYRSNYFPWSKYLTGTQGMAPADGFDPLEFWIEEAHKRGIELHAWINPYRITKKSGYDSKPSVSSLPANHPARLHPDWVIKYSDGNLYFDPGIPEVRQLITNGVMEIVDRYDIDGIHFDDYFYPGRDFNDSATFKKYGQGYDSVGNWRRANITALVSDVSNEIKASGKAVRFGISPFGIWSNRKSNPLGSDTNGAESYYDHYADTRSWVKNGIIDYIAPQLYWNIGYTVADYSKLLTWWKDVVSDTPVDLYIGQAAYRENNPSQSSSWYGVSELERQLLLNSEYPEVKGSLFYNYSALEDSPALVSMIKAVYDRLDGNIPSTPVTVSIPSGNITTSYSHYYLNGASDPGRPLYLNGEPVTNRSLTGYFGILADLRYGSNVFTFTQDGSYVTRVIYRSSGGSSVSKMSKADITSSSVFPQTQEYRQPGEKITLSCTAPAGSKVTVRITGKTYAMKTASKSGGLYPARFTCTYTVPSYTGAPRNIDLGAPVYTMNYKGTVKTKKAPAKIGVIMKGSPFYAEISKEDIDTFAEPVSGNGASYELRRGMVDYVTAMTGSYARLSSGLWVRKTSIATYTSAAQLKPTVGSARYETGVKWDTLILEYPYSMAAVAKFNGEKLVLSISSAQSGVLPALPDNSPFSSVTFLQDGNLGRYILTLKPGRTIEGYYIEKTMTGIMLHIKNPARASGSVRPLTGLTIMLDPGHGGEENGAIGPLGTKYPEKMINLNTALKLRDELQALGANVPMTRTTDITMSLTDRLDASRRTKPDMFLSIHANSMEVNVDISKITGFSVHYKETLAKPLSEVLLARAAETGRINKGVRWDNFYVVRGTWTPSMLIENCFVPNPSDFEIITNEAEQIRLAKSLANGIVQYFSR
ncbi:MAG TPA: family 10 glycosylhydrolase [Clostridia bacterium]|nr:family 10 glycosylhydrolase [Clostridia bacterium]